MSFSVFQKKGLNFDQSNNRIKNIKLFQPQEKNFTFRVCFGQKNMILE